MSTDVVLVGHGSQRTRAFERGLLETARRLQARFAGGPRVRPAFFEFLHPTVQEAIETLAAEGSRRVVVMPYFLFDGKEVTREIPHELDQIRARLPEIEIIQAPSLGVASAMIEMIAERVAAALDGLCQYPHAGGRLPRRGATGPLGVVIVNRGSRARYDDGSRLTEIARRTAERLSCPTATAQAENSERTIEVAARELYAAGARRIVVVPYLHYPGKVLFADVIPAVDRAAAEHSDARFYLAWTLCIDDRLVDVCVDRIVGTGLVAPPSELVVEHSR